MQAVSRRFEKVIRFATVGLVKAGWMMKQKGVWSVTEAGIAALKSYPDPAQLYKEMLKLYRAWHDTQSATAGSQPAAAEGIEADEATVTFEQAQEQAWSEISVYLSKMSPYDFQDLVADLIKATGYHVTYVAPPGKDGGVDIVAHPDALGVQSPQMKVQVKRHAARLPVESVRAFTSTLKNDDVGLFVSIGGFTRDAEEYARLHSDRRLNLIDMQRLVELWTQHYGRLDDQARRRFSLTPIYFLTPAE